MDMMSGFETLRKNEDINKLFIKDKATDKNNTIFAMYTS